MRYRVGHRFVRLWMSMALFGFVLTFWPFVVVAAAADTFEESLPSGEFNDAEAHLRLGVEFFLTEELDVALDEFREAARLKPSYADAYHNLGVTFAKTGDLTGAITAWTEAERLDPDAVSLRYSLSSLVSYNYGISLFRDGHIEQAMKEWQTALRIQSNLSEAHYALGVGFLLKHNPVIAIAHFQSALVWAPEWVQAHIAMGMAHFESHEYELARSAWQQALVLKPSDARAYANLGLLAVQEGNYREAVESLRQAIALQPELRSAHFNLGVALLAKGEVQASVDTFERVLNMDAHLTSARLLLGVAWSRLGDWARAAQWWRAALQKNPFAQEAFWLHHNLGKALMALGSFKDATKEFQWVVAQRPEWAEGWSQLGLSLMSERRWREAEEALGSAVRLQPRWAHLYFAIGNAHAEQGELSKAVQAFREAVNIESNFVEALFHLGIALRAQDHLQEAIDPLRHAAEGGSREAQGLLASMYANGNGVDRNIPLAMLWWSRSSRGAIPDSITRMGKNQLAQLRRRLHRPSLSMTEQQDVLTGFGLIRQDLATHRPSSLPVNVSFENSAIWRQVGSPQVVLKWIVERALALDVVAQEMLREWFVDGVVGSFPPYHDFLQEYWLQVAKEGDHIGCKLMNMARFKGEFLAVRQACLSLHRS